MNKVSLIVYPAKELANNKQIFSRFLGVEPYVDEPYYVGYRVGSMEIGLDPIHPLNWYHFHLHCIINLVKLYRM